MEGIFVFLIVFVIGYFIFGKRKQNPYIKTHQKKWQNEKQYDEYIVWLDSQGGDLPLKEVKFKEDIEIVNEVSKNFNK